MRKFEMGPQRLLKYNLFNPYSAIAQSVERVAVNH